MNGGNPYPNHDNNHVISSATIPCVAIGIAHSMSNDKLNAMPGWNDSSFAFHGDDGHFFHRHGQSGKRDREKDDNTAACCLYIDDLDLLLLLLGTVLEGKA